MSGASLIASLRRLAYGSESHRAEHDRATQWSAALADPEWNSFTDAMRDVPDGVEVGEAIGQDGERAPLRVELDRLRSSHLLLAGATGSGKSMACLGLAAPVIARALRPNGGSLVTVEGKGEFSGLLADRILPRAVAQLPETEREDALSRIHVLDAFSTDAVPMFDVVATPPEVSRDLHLLDLLAGFETAAQAELGVRQRGALSAALKLLGEHNLHLPSLGEIFSNPLLLEALAQRSSPEVRAYFTTRFPNESEEAKSGVLARLDRILASPSRLALSAPGCVDFRDVLGEGVTVISLAAPFGCREAQQFWSATLIARLLRAVFARPNSSSQPPAVILSDEAQDFLQGPHAAEAERVLTQARSRRVALWLACQQFAQLDAASPTLAKALRSNTNFQGLLRSSPEDAHAMRHILPSSGRHPRPAPAPWEKAATPFLTRAEEEKALLDEVSRLPDRVGWFWDRRQPWRAVKFRTRDVDLGCVDEMGSELRRRLRRSRWTRTVAELEQAAADERARLAALTGGSPAARTAELHRSGRKVLNLG